MRLAFFSPLNPAPSGISDYSEELLPYLARYAEMELVVDGAPPTNPALAIFPQRTVNEFAARAARYDAILYHMGNSPAHAAMYKTLLNYPGVVVMHDVVLHHLRAWLTLERGKRREYLDAMREGYGEPGAQAALGEVQGRALADRFEFPLNENVVRAARAIIVHSQYAAKQIQPLVPNTPVAVIPMGIEPAEMISREPARERLKLSAAEFLIAMFGDVQPYKRVLPAMAAFAEFHTAFPNSRLLLVGRTSELFDVRGAAQSLGIANAVQLVGYAPRADYDLYTAAVDVCLNLRYPTAGETSASLLRLFAAEKACIVTDTGAFSDLPDEVCIKLRADAREQENLREAFAFFAESPERGMVLGKLAGAFVEQGHTLDIAAQAYAEFLQEVVEGRAASRSFVRAWTPPALSLRAAVVLNNVRQQSPARQKETASLRQKPVALAITEGDWKEGLAAACAALGMNDDARLRPVARAISALGL